MPEVTRLLAATTTIPAHPRIEDAYFDHQIDVPEGATQLSATLEYRREEPAWDLILLVFDPDGFRGDASLAASDSGPSGDVQLVVKIGNSESFGYWSGPVTPGRWTFQLWAAHIERDLEYTLLVDALSDPRNEPPVSPRGLPMPHMDRILRRSPGWVAGELHTHTTASDGFVTPLELVDHARKAGLDFMAITDHNTIRAWTDLAGVEDVCIIPSLEITLPHGHCNLFGLQQWVDWRQAYRNRDACGILADARTQGALISVNHPFAPGYSWQFDIDTAWFDCIEIINYPNWWPASVEYNLMALGLWTSMLNAGYRLTAVGGSDAFHMVPGTPFGRSPYAEALALPATYVYADELSGVAIQDGLRHGKVYISMGPRIVFEVYANSNSYTMGDFIHNAGGDIELHIEIEGAPKGSTLRLVKNGQVISSHLEHRSSIHLRFVDTPRWSQRNWYRVDLFNRDGEMSVISNPIYVGQPPSNPVETWGQAVARARREQMIIKQTIFE
jgi:hypothetical protein